MSNASLVSSSSRPLRLKMRKDLTFERQTYQGRDYWIVKDPVSLKYYRFEEEEFELLRMLDGTSSPDQIKRRFDYRFAPQKITLQELYQFVGMLYRSSLLVSDANRQGIELLKRHDKTSKKRFRGSLTNILAIRLKGFDPDGILNVMNRYVGWFFSIPCFVITVFVAFLAIGLLTTNWELFQNRLPSFQDFFASKNWFWLSLTLAATKILHEFGHGLSCKRFGGQCHEMGVMFLVLTPCLYCNVSDAWTLPSKWKRITIAVAGMYVELVLASICTFIWWFSQPGMVNALALNVMFVCSVSTLLFNANPLLRYDGYYILSDWLEIPNLRQKATTILKNTMADWCLGMPVQDDPFLPKRNKWLFVFYSVAAAAYKWFITFSIFFFVYKLLEPYGFKIIGQMIAMMAIYGLIGHPLIQLVKFFMVPGRLYAVKPLKLTVSASLAIAVLTAIMMIPIPYYVTCSLHVQPLDGQTVFVEIPGRISQQFCQHNDAIQKGDPILRLVNTGFEKQIVDLDGQLRIANAVYHSSERIASFDAKYTGDRDEALVTYNNLVHKINRQNIDWEKLVVRSPISGTVVSADYVAKPKDDDGRLSNWFGTPLESRNLGAYLDEGTTVCTIVPDLGQFEAILAIDQSDVEFIRRDQPVEIWIRQNPANLYESKINLISPVQMKAVPKCLSSRFGGDLMTIPGANGEDLPQSTTFQVSVPFSDTSGLIQPGASGVAKIRAGDRTVGQRFWRIVVKTFRFEL